MNIVIDNFSYKLACHLKELANQILQGDESFKYLIGKSCNESFFLRAHLSIIKKEEEDELSITVDIQESGNDILIESDIVDGYGTIIVDGPIVKLSYELSNLEIQNQIDEWFYRFNHLFIDKKEKIDIAIKKLK